jgi:hypothetical protein
MTLSQGASFLDDMVAKHLPKSVDGINLAPLTLDELNRARLTPRCLVPGLLYADLRTRIASGGTGKTTLALYEAVVLALCRELWGRQPDLDNSTSRMNLTRKQLRTAVTSLKVAGKVVYNHVNGKPGSHFQPVTVANACGDGCRSFPSSFPDPRRNKTATVGDGGDGGERDLLIASMDSLGALMVSDSAAYRKRHMKDVDCG